MAVATAPRQTTKIARWGNSDAVRIPRRLLDLVGLGLGDDVSIEFDGSGSLVISPVARGHRHVRPYPRTTFNELFLDYRVEPEHDRAAVSEPFPEESLGAEKEAWGA